MDTTSLNIQISYLLNNISINELVYTTFIKFEHFTLSSQKILKKYNILITKHSYFYAL